LVRQDRREVIARGIFTSVSDLARKLRTLHQRIFRQCSADPVGNTLTPLAASAVTKSLRQATRCAGHRWSGRSDPRCRSCSSSNETATGSVGSISKSYGPFGAVAPPHSAVISISALAADVAPSLTTPPEPALSEVSGQCPRPLAPSSSPGASPDALRPCCLHPSSGAGTAGSPE